MAENERKYARRKQMRDFRSIKKFSRESTVDTIASAYISTVTNNRDTSKGARRLLAVTVTLWLPFDLTGGFKAKANSRTYEKK